MYQSQRDEGFTGEPYYGDSAVYVSPPTRTRRRLIIVAAFLVALLIGAVAVDRIAAARAESRTAEAFQDGMGTADRPSVHVSGFPVLAQLAEGRLNHVDLTAHGIPANGTTRPLPVTKLTVGMDGLKTSGDADEAHARSVRANAHLSYADVSHALGVEVSQGDESGRIDATASLPLVGDVTVSAAVSAASGNGIAFTDVRAEQGELLPPLKSLLDKALYEPIPLQNVPEGLRLRSVTTTEDGIDARFSGRSVTFRPDSSSFHASSVEVGEGAPSDLVSVVRR
ncbi:LmeA family phospholipid-binding protein [Streptomyces sp. NPDC001920]